jgi:hypothetical protein
MAHKNGSYSIIALYRQAHHVVLGGYSKGERKEKVLERQRVLMAEAEKGSVTANMALIYVPRNIKADGQHEHPSPLRRAARLINPGHRYKS